MNSAANKSSSNVHWWNPERVNNGLRRYARDFFENDLQSLPQYSYGYKIAVPIDQRRCARQLRLYPPFDAVLRQYENLPDAWTSLGYQVNPKKRRQSAAEIKGERFGRLTALEYSHSTSSSGRIWKCRCICGNESFVAAKNLLRSRVLSCGCYRRTVVAKQMGRKRIRNLLAEKRKFGRLKPLEIAGKYLGKETLWECQCDCGARVRVPVSSLTTHATRSCGCLRSETTKQRINAYWKNKKSTEDGQPSAVLN